MSKKIIAQNEEIVIGVDVSDAKHNAAVVRVRGGELIRDDKVARISARGRSILRSFPAAR